MSKPSNEDINAGQAPYNRIFLSVYDFMILGVFCRFIWKCPKRFILDNYNRNISANHLDVGVGTGYHLDNCRFPSGTIRLALMDLNETCLEVTGRRLARYKPEKYCGDAYSPFNAGRQRFDSVALNGLLHCLPGASIQEKSVVFDHVKQVLNPGGVVFGCTILNKNATKGRAAQFMLKVTNNSRAFCNLGDDVNDLKEELSKRFKDVHINVIGCMAIFSAR